MVPRGTAERAPTPAAFNPAGARPGSAAPRKPRRPGCCRLLIRVGPARARKAAAAFAPDLRAKRQGSPGGKVIVAVTVWALSTPAGPRRPDGTASPPRPQPTRSPEARSPRPRCSPRGSGSCFP
ncbi:unnamed protein product [Rangifer tarandus platyrhynchus]|uniref:Uncharacterized protein n=2 Tax=Rangifer tarandus platyrhynchus TaxID=3082113 RepID=A0ACB0EG17_RANTA|nr:unnamed protein product [Rangifer tarandus platyrhynchus]CAI9699194.1 unnamed protein product [Rangifer tarandus platyrhynchus]